MSTNATAALRGAFNEDRHLDVDLLTGLDLKEVNVLDDALDRVLLHVLATAILVLPSKAMVNRALV